MVIAEAAARSSHSGRAPGARLLWLAHALTVVRIPLAIAFWAVAPRTGAALAILAVAAATDLVDGRIARAARRRGVPPRLDVGSWLDPVCDKTFAVVILGALVVRLDVPWSLIALIGARELVLVPVAAVLRVSPLWRRYRPEVRAAPAGKAATVAQFLAIGAVLIGVAGAAAFAAAAAAIGLYAAATYLVRAAQGVRGGGPGAHGVRAAG